MSVGRAHSRARGIGRTFATFEMRRLRSQAACRNTCGRTSATCAQRRLRSRAIFPHAGPL